MKLIAVTGTKGKTTTCYLIKSILEKAGKRIGMLGTIKYCLGSGQEISATLTTPLREDINKYVSAMRENGCDWGVIEVSSQGISEGRIADLSFDIAVCTNIRPEHLEYHKTYEGYRHAKSLLFSGLRQSAIAVLNGEDGESAYLFELTKAQIRKFGIQGRRVEMVWSGLDRSILDLKFGPVLNERVLTPIAGSWNLANISAAITAALEAGAARSSVIKGIMVPESPVGRLEWVPVPDKLGFKVVVDYAHTPESYRAILCFLRSFCTNKLIVVAGMAPARYREKRPIIGRMIEAVSDMIFLTPIRPDGEDQEQIMRDICGEMQYPHRVKYHLDRATAIGQAIEAARPGDIVALLDRGHEGEPNDVGLAMKAIHE